jgi:hypothetical protein
LIRPAALTATETLSPQAFATVTVVAVVALPRESNPMALGAEIDTPEDAAESGIVSGAPAPAWTV